MRSRKVWLLARELWDRDTLVSWFPLSVFPGTKLGEDSACHTARELAREKREHGYTGRSEVHTLYEFRTRTYKGRESVAFVVRAVELKAATTRED